MSERLTLLALLGVDTLADAAEIWPRTTLLPGLGLSGSIEEPGDHVPVIDYLNTVLRFAAVRPGSATATVGLIAEVTIEPHPSPSRWSFVSCPISAFCCSRTRPRTPHGCS